MFLCDMGLVYTAQFLCSWLLNLILKVVLLFQSFLVNTVSYLKDIIMRVKGTVSDIQVADGSPFEEANVHLTLVSMN